MTTGLTEDGSFWAQLANEDGKPYDALMEDLQAFAESEGLPSPAFLNPGDYCAAVYSEDGQWYRAQVESSTGQSLRVRFLDFGNEDQCSLGQVMRLSPRFRQLPFQALHCSLALPEHREFSAKEREKFDEVVPLDERLEVVVKDLEGAVATVEIFLPTSPPVDLSDVIYTAGPSISLSFSPFSSRGHWVASERVECWSQCPPTHSKWVPTSQPGG